MKPWIHNRSAASHLVPGAGRLPFPAYRGEEPFIFASYAHANADIVFPEIRRLHDMGYRIWYDEGISPGSEWKEEISEALEKCALFLVFITPESAASENVQNEIRFAMDDRKPVIAIHLEETRLSGGLKLEIGSRQAILAWNMTEEEYVYKITSALTRHGLQPGEPPAAPEKGKPLHRRPLFWIILILVLAAIGIGLWIVFAPIPCGGPGCGLPTPSPSPTLITDIPPAETDTPEPVSSESTIPPSETESPEPASSEPASLPAETATPPAETVTSAPESERLPYVWVAEGDHVAIVSYDLDAETLEIPAEINGLPVTEITFYTNATSTSLPLKSVSLPDTLTHLGAYAFAHCHSLTSVTLPPSLVEIGSGAFWDCVSLEKIALPEGLTAVGELAFFGCASLTEVSLPSTLETLAGNVFASCTRLASLSLPEKLQSIGMNCFLSCSGLQELTLPDGITVIPQNAFLGCTLLKSITIPASVVTIEDNAFMQCTLLSEIRFGGTEARWQAIAVASGNEVLNKITPVFAGGEGEEQGS